MLDGTLVIDSANKVSANHVLGSGNCKLKYTYVHGGLTIEPSYELAKDSWDFAVSRKVYTDHVLRAVYQTSNQNLALDWTTKSQMAGSYKVLITLCSLFSQQIFGFMSFIGNSLWKLPKLHSNEQLLNKN